jgi:RNA polymerase sigma-70 factor (ECF subfamily)
MSIGEAFVPILAAAQSDAGWAYERLYRDLAPVVFGYLRHQGAREPEDLTSEVFLGAFARLNTFRGSEEQFRSWVFTIAYRRLVDERRRGRILPSADSDVWANDREGGDVEVDALRYFGRQQVRRLLDQISPAQRDVLILRLLGDFTVEQAAAVLGKSTGAVKALQARGLTALRSQGAALNLA